MTDIYGSDRDAGKQEPEVEEISGSRFDRGADLDDRGLADTDVVDADVIGDELDDDTTEIISGASPEFADVKDALAQRDEYLDSLRRLQAEFENYKKRVAKQQGDQVARAALSLVDKLLPVLDTLDLATSHIGNAESADGRALVAASGQLRDVLAKEGLERIDPLGEEFDPTAHEAVGQVAPEAGEDGAAGSAGPDQTAAVPARGEPVVAEVMRPGYRWRGAVVRPAMVMVKG
ncbi:MAG: nucleotide exchange factor GrpE [Acidimicrobiales bacterium]|jgi:molecular chaperone GrpE